MVRLIIFPLLLVSTLVFGQNSQLLVKYAMQQTFLTSDYHLVIADGLTVWEEVSNPTLAKPNPNYFADDDYKRKILYKDTKQQLMYSDLSVLSAMFYLKEDVKPQAWRLLDEETEDFLGYNCRKAATNFRGRYYEVLFTPEIPIDAGPWKFSGLPGLILKVSTPENDNDYVIECTGIEKHDEEREKDFATYLRKRRKKKFQNWDEFVGDFDNFLERHINSIRSDVAEEGDSGFTLQLKINNHLEIFSEEIQTDGIFVEF